MKHILMIVAIAGVLAGCTQRTPVEVATVYGNEGKSFLALHSAYVKDPRTGLCFLYGETTGESSGGPAIANVPCDAVPKEILQ